MSVTTTAPQNHASSEPDDRRCGSAEAAVVRWALAHLEASRFSLPAVQRDDAAEADEQA